MGRHLPCKETHAGSNPVASTKIRWLGGLGFLSLRGLQTLSSPVLKRVTFSRPHDVKAAVGGTTKGRDAHANLFVIPYGNIQPSKAHFWVFCYRTGAC